MTESRSATRLAVHTGLRPEDAAPRSRSRPGPPAAVGTLFDRHHESVYGLAMSILRNKSDSEEATRDVFLAAMGKADPFQWNAVFPSWIYRICVNTCLTLLRRGRRTDPVPIEEFLPAFTMEGAHASPVEDWSREVWRRIPEKEFGQVIGGFAGELPEINRVVFALCDARGFSCEETAQVLELPVTEVKFHLHRARLCLRERLGRYLRDGRVS